MPTSVATSASPWAALLPAALAGTRRQPFAPLPGLTPDLGSEANAPEKQLLLTAANLRLVQRAGQRPTCGSAEGVGRAPAETLPVLGPVGTRVLREILAVETLPFLRDDFVHQLVGAGYRLAHHTLAELLPKHIRDELNYFLNWTFSVSGQRGPWLRDLYFDSPVGRAERQARAQSAEQQRHDQLRRNLNLLDRQQPPESWEWLMAELQAGPSEARRALVASLSGWQDLSPLPGNLEAVLEGLLRQQHGYLAAEALLHLPGSALLARHWARAQLLLTYDPGSGQVLVSLVTPDDTWRLDFIHDNHNYLESKELQALRSLLQVVPPTRWATAWQLTPAQAVARVAASPHADFILNAWLGAAQRYQALEFVRPLLDYFAHHPQQLTISYLNYVVVMFKVLVPVINLLPEPERAAWLVAQIPDLASEPQYYPVGSFATPTLPWMEWLWNCLGTTRRALVSALLPYLRRQLEQPSNPATEHLERSLGALLSNDLVAVAELSMLPWLRTELLPLTKTQPKRPLSQAIRLAEQRLALRQTLAESLNQLSAPTT